ncbi:MAG: TolC family protein [Saprospiraceae bacterium]
MKCKITSIIVFVLFMTANTQAQSSLESVLRSVEQQNKSLIATQQFWESRKLEYTTGLTLPNPTIQGQYLFGSPAVAGDQTDLFIVQSFDFPTVYKQRRDLAKAQGSVSSAHIAGLRQEILLETKLVCIDLVYRLKLDRYYHRRSMALQGLLKDFQQKLDQGDATILDLNKVKLQIIEHRQLQTENQIDLEKLQTQLAELNGGQAIAFVDTLYPDIPGIPPFDQLEKEVESADPLRMTLEQERYISEKQLNLARTWRLPKFEAGYHYQGILGQQFNGIHAGLTLPIWEQKNRIQFQQAQVQYAERELENHRNEHYFEIREMYDRQESLQSWLTEYREIMTTVQQPDLLNKSLRLGEITTMEYFLEMSFYQNAILHLYKAERDFQIAVARLLKYRL